MRQDPTAPDTSRQAATPPAPGRTWQAFFDEVCRRAENNMLRTKKLEGMHYAAMRELKAEWDAAPALSRIVDGWSVEIARDPPYPDIVRVRSPEGVAIVLTEADSLLHRYFFGVAFAAMAEPTITREAFRKFFEENSADVLNAAGANHVFDLIVATR